MARYYIKEMNDVGGSGKRKVFPTLERRENITTEKFIEEMKSYQRAIDKSVLKAVVMEAADTLARLLSEGHTVTLDDIGTFSMSLKFIDERPTEIESDSDKMLYRRVGVKDVNFRVSKGLMGTLQRKTKFERLTTGVKILKKRIYTREERIENALRIIGEKGYMTLGDYVEINNVTLSTASRELASLTSDPTSPISHTGRGNHKIWLRRQPE